MRSYVFVVFAYKKTESETEINHYELGKYESETLPWVPPKGSFFRFRDSNPPGKSVNHKEVAGYVEDIVTCFYGTNTVIEVYVRPRD